MSALTEVSANNAILDGVRTIVAEELWAWIAAHQDNEVFEIGFLGIFHKTFYVRDLEAFATLLLGPKPASVI